MSEALSEPAGKVVSFEVPAGDTTRAIRFYGDLFGWQFERKDGPMECHVTYAGGGAIRLAGHRRILVTFSTPDIDARSPGDPTERKR